MVLPRQIYNSRQQMEFAQDWFWYIEHCWFPRQMLNLPSLSEAVEIINELLDNIWIQGDADRALFEIERIQKNLIDMNPFEKGVSAKLCAHILLAMSDREQAEEMMRQAIIWMPSSYKHYVAVLTWHFGTIHWIRSNRHTDAINEWKAAIKLFNEISIDPGLTLHKKKWYQDQLVLMRSAIRKAIEIDQLPPLHDFKTLLTCKNIPKRRTFGSTGPRFIQDEQDFDDDDLDLQLPIPVPENFLQVMDVYEGIPAGIVGPIKVIPVGYLEVSQVLFEDQEFRIHILEQGRKRLRLVRDSHFFAIRVNGHSMNNAGKAGKDAILDGDYVLIRSQSSAENGDIVAAEIVGVDNSYATLKRYSRQGNTILLKAESLSKNFAGARGEWEFNAAEENKSGKFYIRGVVIAILKPL